MRPGGVFAADALAESRVGCVGVIVFERWRLVEDFVGHALIGDGTACLEFATLGV